MNDSEKRENVTLENRRKATRRDVARLASVSCTTVTNVLNNSRLVRDETAQRVLQAINQLGYRPDYAARSLATGRAMQVSIVLHDVRNPLYGEIISEFEKAASKRKYFVNICTSQRSIDDYFEDFIARRVDGVFVTALPHQFQFDKLYSLIRHGIAVVTSGYLNLGGIGVSTMDHDYYNAMEEAVAHLYTLGHRRIAYLSGLGRQMDYDTRCDAYLKAMKNRDSSISDELLISGKAPYDTNLESGYFYAKELLATGRPFTAVICSNDLIAIGAMKALRESGLEVPKHVSVVGFDGMDIGNYTSPSLTTMAMDKAMIGRRAFELLYRAMETRQSCHYLSRLTLKIGGSTAVPLGTAD